MRNYLVVLLRTLYRERLYAAINVAGLSLGIACCLILGLYLRSELTYDRYNVNHDRIYRVVNELDLRGSNDRFAATSRALGPMLAADYPQIKAVVRFQSNANQGGVAVHHGKDTYLWKNSYFVDENVFDVFTHKIIYGDPKTALRQQGGVAVSETFARKYFGNANPIGEPITTDLGVGNNRITLVFADQPANTHLKYDMLWSDFELPFLRISDNPTMRRNALFNIGDFTYIMVAPGFDPKSWTRISDEFYHRYMESFGKQIGATGWHSWLQPLTEIHLQSEVRYDQPNGNPIYLYGCAAVALFILIVACINYMNLATARAAHRARSVGIRKILGASRLTLGLQFLGESLFFALLATLLGVVIVEVVLKLTPLNSLMGGTVALNLRGEPALIAWLTGLALLMGLLSGLYPAVYLSSWAPLTALTGKPTAGKSALRLREALVLLQFTISAAVIACTLLMGAQMRYIANKSLGFEKENRLVVTLRGTTTIDKIPTLRTEFAKNSHILGVSEAEVMLGQDTGINLVQADNNDGALTPVSMLNVPIGDDFVQVMGLKILQGRDFSRRLLTDVGSNFLVNEAMVHKMGWAEPIGKRIQAGPNSGRVVGVVGDFNFKSLHTPIEPLAMLPLTHDFSQVPEIFRVFLQRLLVLKISGDDVSDTLGYVERVMSEVDPKHPFEYQFLDEALDALYKSEHQLNRLVAIFAGVCIFIACLGLFGLASFTTEQRNREIGTRKVLGASTWQIIALLARSILILVAIAAVIAAVIAYFAIDKWLTAFAFRAPINPLIFLLTAAVAAVVAFTTVALQSYKTASADPVNALRHV
jgi:putative ABC transport system permease protein